MTTASDTVRYSDTSPVICQPTTAPCSASEPPETIAFCSARSSTVRVAVVWSAAVAPPKPV